MISTCILFGNLLSVFYAAAAGSILIFFMSTLLHDRRPPRKPNDVLENERFIFPRVSTLNVLLKRRAAIYAGRSFNLTLTEWRIMTLLRTLPPISVRELAIEALADAAQISRAAAKLAAKGYLIRKRSARDNREILLGLSKRGQNLSEELYQASLHRNDQLLACYDAATIRRLANTLDELIERARAMLELEISHS
jgi:DNA-binding MarR family transcriptional regulator